MDLPVKASEAAALAELTLPHGGSKPLNDDLRNRLAGRAAQLHLSTFQPHYGSLARDPLHPSTYYLAVDGRASQPLLLHISLASAPTSGIFHNALRIGRMRASGAEIVVNSIPFASTDRENVSRYAAQVDPTFLPRPQGARPAIAVGSGSPQAFEDFRTILKKTGVNLASTADYHSSLWAAIRAGWREGYTVEADPIVAGSIESAKDAIAQAAGCTKFSTDASHLFIDPQTWTDSAVEEKFIELFPPEERRWVESEFAKQFSAAQFQRLAVKFGRSLQWNENLYDAIKQRTRAFDFEPSLAETATPTTPQELIFYLHWLKARGRPAQLVAPNPR